MRRVFFVSAVLVVLTALIAWLTPKLFAPQEEPQPDTDGTVTITVLQNGAVHTLALSDWLPGVLAAEMPASFEPEALRAQAVAARTYILERAAHRPPAHPDADVCDDPGCCTAWLSDSEMQERWGAASEENRAVIMAAVADTDGAVLQYDGEPIREVNMEGREDVETSVYYNSDPDDSYTDDYSDEDPDEDFPGEPDMDQNDGISIYDVDELQDAETDDFE